MCPGEPVELTCIAFVRGLLSWFSDCYIGDGGQSIAFFSNTPNGTRKNSTADQDVFAVLNSIYNVGALPELNSSLYIETVKEEPCTIICNTSDGLQMNITIQKLGNDVSVEEARSHYLQYFVLICAIPIYAGEANIVQDLCGIMKTANERLGTNTYVYKCTLYVHGSLISSRFIPIICLLINFVLYYRRLSWGASKLCSSEYYKQCYKH